MKPGFALAGGGITKRTQKNPDWTYSMGAFLARKRGANSLRSNKVRNLFKRLPLGQDNRPRTVEEETFRAALEMDRESYFSA